MASMNRLSAGVLLMLCSCLFVSTVSANTDSPRIGKVKAAFIINIARYVSWPQTNTTTATQAPMLMCYYISNFLGAAVDTIADQTIAGRPLTFTTIQHLDDGHGCNIILVPATQLDNFKNEAIKGFNKPALTITDLTNTNIAAGQTHAGIIVALVRKGNGIGFEINLPRSTDMEIKMSSELLRLATIVGQ